MRLSYLDDTFSIYHNKSIIVFGTADKGRIIKENLHSLGLEIAYFCDNDSKIWGCHIDGIEVISPKRLKMINGENFIIQIASGGTRDIERQLQEQGIVNYIPYDEYSARICELGKYRLFKNNYTKNYYLQKANIFNPVMTKDDRPIWDYIAKSQLFNQDSFLILCLPPKTGDFTLNASLQRANIDFVNLWHSGFRYTTHAGEILSTKKNKIVTAVREPISQNLSIFFNMAEYLWDVPEYWRNGGDVQLLFDSWIEHELGSNLNMFSKGKISSFPFFEYFKRAEGIEYVIQYWFEKSFNRYFNINLTEYPFDKDKGYSVIKAGNMEIFVYQIEKLNQIKDELGEFVGAKNLVLFNGNVGDDKWYKRAYKEAKRKIILTEKYMNICYELKWVQHFYSKEDIESFKQLWGKHCKLR